MGAERFLAVCSALGRFVFCVEVEAFWFSTLGFTV